MDIAIPTDALQMETDLSTTPLISKAVHEDNREHALRYFRDHNIAVFLDCVLTELYVDRPEDPLGWFMKFLAKHDVFDDLLQSRMSILMSIKSVIYFFFCR